MSTYQFTITKRHIMETQDSTQWRGDAETFADSTAQAAAQADIDVSVYLDDVIKHTVTLTDAGATLQFDADITAGDHTIRIVPAKDPIQHTDVCVDQLTIDGSVAVCSQYDFNNTILGTASTLRQMVSPHNTAAHNQVWWGAMITGDSQYNLTGPFYRPCIVSDHQGEWHMDFTKTANGDVWITHHGDVDDPLYDSTAQHTYRLVVANDSAAADVAYHTWLNDPDNSTYFSMWVDDGGYTGPGTYTQDSTTLINLNSDVSTVEDANNIVILSNSEYSDHYKQLWYHRNYTVTAITVT